jgi:prolyl-tRNA synthetase
MGVIDTPETPTIESLVERLNATGTAGRSDWTARDTLKNIVVRLDGPGATGPELVVIGVPGDREVDLGRLSAAVFPRTAALAEATAFAERADLVRGYIGPQLLAKLGLRFLVDPRIVPGTAWVTGANEAGRHAVHVVCGRDFTPDGTVEAADVRAGDPCPTCGGPLDIRRGIEVGHIFQLGRGYADVFELDAAGPDGRPIRITMGSYGIGISRVMAAIVEQHHDERGIAWPPAVAPCDVQLVPTGAAQLAIAEQVAATLAAAGVRVLLDDRPGLSAGIRFTDGELIGMPAVVVVGRRAADGFGEPRIRAIGERRDVPLRVREL